MPASWSCFERGNACKVLGTVPRAEEGLNKHKEEQPGSQHQAHPALCFLGRFFFLLPSSSLGPAPLWAGTHTDLHRLGTRVAGSLEMIPLFQLLHGKVKNQRGKNGSEVTQRDTVEPGWGLGVP